MIFVFNTTKDRIHKRKKESIHLQESTFKY